MFKGGEHPADADHTRLMAQLLQKLSQREPAGEKEQTTFTADLFFALQKHVRFRAHLHCTAELESNVGRQSCSCTGDFLSGFRVCTAELSLDFCTCIPACCQGYNGTKKRGAELDICPRNPQVLDVRDVEQEEYYKQSVLF